MAVREVDAGREAEERRNEKLFDFLFLRVSELGWCVSREIFMHEIFDYYFVMIVVSRVSQVRCQMNCTHSRVCVCDGFNFSDLVDGFALDR